MMSCLENMSLVRSLCYQMLLLSIVVRNHAQPEEPSFKKQTMKICAKQQTTEQLMYSVEVVTIIECAVLCGSHVGCKSANLCSNGHRTECTLSGRFAINKCDNNTANNYCNYLITETPCLHGGTLGTAGNCTCGGSYTGDVCERLYYDCSELPRRDQYRQIWIQHGGHPPFKVMCYWQATYVFRFTAYSTRDFPLNKTFEKYKTEWTIGYYFINGGLEGIHIATSQAHYTLRVDIYSVGMNSKTTYLNFTLGSESERYRLDYTNKSSGPDVFADMKGRPFSAIGNDPEGCAQMYNVAWWYTADCQPPMIYNANGKITIPDESNSNITIDGEFMNMYIRFRGFK